MFVFSYVYANTHTHRSKARHPHMCVLIYLCFVLSSRVAPRVALWSCDCSLFDTWCRNWITFGC